MAVTGVTCDQVAALLARPGAHCLGRGWLGGERMPRSHPAPSSIPVPALRQLGVRGRGFSSRLGCRRQKEAVFACSFACSPVTAKCSETWVHLPSWALAFLFCRFGGGGVRSHWEGQLDWAQAWECDPRRLPQMPAYRGVTPRVCSLRGASGRGRPRPWWRTTPETRSPSRGGHSWSSEQACEEVRDIGQLQWDQSWQP